MSEPTGLNDEDQNQSIPSDPSPTPEPNDTEPQDDKASEKSLSSLEEDKSNSQESSIGTPTLEAITAIEAIADGDSEDEDKNEDADEDGNNTHAGSPNPQDFEIWSDGTFDEDESGNGNNNGDNHQGNTHDGSNDQESPQGENDNSNGGGGDDEEDKDETLNGRTSPKSASLELLSPPRNPPNPNQSQTQPPLSALAEAQQLPSSNVNPQTHPVPPLPEQQLDSELQPTHGLPPADWLGLLGQPLQDNQLHHGIESLDGQAWPGQASNVPNNPGQGRGWDGIGRDVNRFPVFPRLPSPAIPLLIQSQEPSNRVQQVQQPQPANGVPLGHRFAPQYPDQGQHEYQRHRQQCLLEQSLHRQLQRPELRRRQLQQLLRDEVYRQFYQNQHHPPLAYENGVPIGGGIIGQPYPANVLPTIENANDQHGIAGSAPDNPISLSGDSEDTSESSNNGSCLETAISISSGSSENAGSGPAPAGDVVSGQDQNEVAIQAPAENSTAVQGRNDGSTLETAVSVRSDSDNEGSNPVPENGQNDRELVSPANDQRESEYVSPYDQVPPVFGSSSSETRRQALGESVAREANCPEEETYRQGQQELYDPTSPTWSPTLGRQTAEQDEAGPSNPEPASADSPVPPVPRVYDNPHLNPNYPYSPTSHAIPGTNQEFGQDTEQNTERNSGRSEQNVEEGPVDYPQRPSEHIPEGDAIYETLIDPDHLNAPIALARDIVDLMRSIINSSSQHSSSGSFSPNIFHGRDRFFEPESWSEQTTFASSPGSSRQYVYVPTVPESPGIEPSEESLPSVSERGAELESAPVPVPAINTEPRRSKAPEEDTKSEPEKQDPTPLTLPQPDPPSSYLGTRESPGVGPSRMSSKPVLELEIDIEPGQDEVPEISQESGPTPVLEAGHEDDRVLKSGKMSDSGSTTETTSNIEPRQDNVSAEQEAETAKVQSVFEEREVSALAGEYKPGPEPDTDSDSEAEVEGSQQLGADLEQHEPGNRGREQEQKSDTNTEPEHQPEEGVEHDEDESAYQSARESAPSPSSYQTPPLAPPARSPSPPPRRVTRAYARQLEQGLQTTTQINAAAEQKVERGPSKTKKGKGKQKVREPTLSPPPRGIKRKESSSPSPPPPSPPKRRVTRSQTLQQEPKKADSNSSKGKGKGKGTTKSTTARTATAPPKTITTAKAVSRGTKRRAESLPDIQTPIIKKRRVTETEPEQPALKLRPNPKVATRTNEQQQRLNNPPTAKRSVYVFGTNSRGQLGLGHAEANVTHPTLNTGLTKDTVGVVDLAAGGNHCVALTHDNRILTWGDNSDGQLGRETRSQERSVDSGTGEPEPNEEETTPMEVNFTAAGLPAETVFVQVAATESATFVLTEFGDVYGWGTFRETYTNEADEEVTILIGFRPAATFQRTPLHIPELKYVKRLATGAQHVLALTLTEDADLIKSKSSIRRASAIPTTSTNRVTKSKPNIKNRSKIKSKRSTKAKPKNTLKPENAVFAWGAYKRDQLGRRILGRQRTATAGLTPRLVALPGKTKCDIASIGTGTYHSFAVKVDGYVYAWGYNRYGQTGVVDGVNLLERDSTVPVPTGLGDVGLGCFEPDRDYTLTGGRDHSLAVTDDGRCLSWGSVEGNVLGIRRDVMSEDDLLFEDEDSETPSILTKPTIVSGVSSRVEKASAGLGHSILVTKSGTAYSWGSNGEYEVKQPRSDGVELPSAIQTSVLRGLRVVDAAAGGQFSVLLVE